MTNWIWSLFTLLVEISVCTCRVFWGNSSGSSLAFTIRTHWILSPSWCQKMLSPQTQVFFLLLTNQVWRQVVSPFRGAETSSRARGLFRLATFVLKQNGNKLHDGNKQHGNKINRCQIVHLGAEKEKEEKTSSCQKLFHPGRSLILQLFLWQIFFWIEACKLNTMGKLTFAWSAIAKKSVNANSLVPVWLSTG